MTETIKYYNKGFSFSRHLSLSWKRMKKSLLFLFFLASASSLAQQKVQKIIESAATHIHIFIEGVDNLQIETSYDHLIEITILDNDGLGVFDSFSCVANSCTLTIKTELKETDDLTNKINQFPMAPPTNVNAIIKIPKNKSVAITGEMIDIQSMGYSGKLKLTVDKGNIRILSIKGVVVSNVFSGAVYATIDNGIALDISTRKGLISLDKKSVRSPYIKKESGEKQLIIRSVNANVLLTTKKTQ